MDIIFVFKTYKNSKYMAQDIKRAMICCSSNTTFDVLKVIPKQEDVEKYIVGLFDIEANRQLIFRKGKAVQVFRDTLFGGAGTECERKKIFVNALLNHNKTVYQTLLADMISELSSKPKV